MPPVAPTPHVLHEYRVLLVIVAFALVAAAVAIWIAVVNYHEECDWSARRRAPRPPDYRRPRR